MGGGLSPSWAGPGPWTLKLASPTSPQSAFISLINLSGPNKASSQAPVYSAPLTGWYGYLAGVAAEFQQEGGFFLSPLL